MEVFKNIVVLLKGFFSTFGTTPFKTFLEVVFGGWLIAAFADFYAYIDIPFAAFNYVGLVVGIVYLFNLKWK